MDDLKKIILEKEFKERTAWLIKLRWFAAAGVLLVITFSNRYIVTGLPLFPLYAGNLLLFIHNAVLYLINRNIGKEKDIHIWFTKANRFANIQIGVDWLLLVWLIHFSGGLENPFIFYFIFHMVIAGILLSKKASFIQAFIAIGYMACIGFGEYYKLIPHFFLSGFVPETLIFSGPWYTIGLFTVFSTTMMLTVYMTTSIVDRLREGEKELVIANQKLEEQDRLKSQYVLTVSHDIQVSLAAIQSCLKVVLSNFTGSISDKAREMVARAENRSRFLLGFVKDLLDLSRIRASKHLEKESLSLNNLAKKVIGQFKSNADEKQLHLEMEFSDEVTVLANVETLEHVFLNLIHNAIRYTPQGGAVRVKLQCLKNPEFVQVTISDTGIGIPREELKHIFEDFYRAQNAEIFEKNGTGLGLSIVKQIVDAHGGEIRVDSHIGKGTKFIFTLPKTER